MKIIDTYKENGITINVLKGCDFVPRPVRKEPKNKGLHASKSQVKEIRDWVNAGGYLAGRRTQLSNVTRIDIRRVRSLLAPPATHSSRMTQSEFALFSDAIAFIERREAQGEAA